MKSWLCQLQICECDTLTNISTILSRIVSFCFCFCLAFIVFSSFVLHLLLLHLKNGNGAFKFRLQTQEIDKRSFIFSLFVSIFPRNWNFEIDSIFSSNKLLSVREHISIILEFQFRFFCLCVCDSIFSVDARLCLNKRAHSKHLNWKHKLHLLTLFFHYFFFLVYTSVFCHWIFRMSHFDRFFFSISFYQSISLCHIF